MEISGIVSDARYAIPGDLFVCVDNSSDDQDPHDGHEDVGDADPRGAVAVSSERGRWVRGKRQRSARGKVVKSTKVFLGNSGRRFTKIRPENWS